MPENQSTIAYPDRAGNHGLVTLTRLDWMLYSVAGESGIAIAELKARQ